MSALLKLWLPALLLLASCHRSPQLASRDYEHARVKYLELLKTYVDQAYGKPEMDEVVDLLQKVPPDSIDAASAQDLLAQIEEGRKVFQARQAETNRLLEAAGPIREVPGFSGQTAPAPVPAEPEGAPRPTRGMKLDDFKKGFGDCFEMKSPIEIQFSGADGRLGAPEMGEAWGMKASDECKKRYPAEAEVYLLFAKGALRAVRPASEAVRVEAKAPVAKQVEIEAVKLEDGGYARQEDGGLVPIPPDQIVPK